MEKFIAQNAFGVNVELSLEGAVACAGMEAEYANMLADVEAGAYEARDEFLSALRTELAASSKARVREFAAGLRFV